MATATQTTGPPLAACPTEPPRLGGRNRDQGTRPRPHSWPRSSAAAPIRHPRLLLLRGGCESVHWHGWRLEPARAATVAKDLGDDQAARGTLLLFSSPVGETSMGAPNAERTLFTGAVLEVLHQGLEVRPPYLFFAELRDAAFDRMVVGAIPSLPSADRDLTNCYLNSIGGSQPISQKENILCPLTGHLYGFRPNAVRLQQVGLWGNIAPKPGCGCALHSRSKKD